MPMLPLQLPQGCLLVLVMMLVCVATGSTLEGLFCMRSPALPRASQAVKTCRVISFRREEECHLAQPPCYSFAALSQQAIDRLKFLCGSSVVRTVSTVNIPFA